ncbi:hypothetical protein CUB95_05530 [Prevotella intermedia]|uniref:hypothetical protein n=1 Tax=Prevotella intermedia TaxID=28131 RepID=UPI000C1BE6F1|nr:hypothetical protein [Prevotella intermedia]ATV38049.1 hypothetical protein CUB95_05530 [Prevotella intermedia]
MKKSIFHYALSSLLVGGIALSAASCADDDINPSGGTDGDALVRFSINDVQEQAVSRGLEMTRGAIATGLSNADLAGGRLEAHNNAGLDVCLIETTVEGVNPIKADARTRADIIKTATLGDFSSTGIRGTSATSILSTPEWFKAQKTKKNGELYSPIRWAFSQPYARFFAVHPAKENYSKMTINDMAAADIAPSVDFEVEPNVRDQKDFMTACTGDVHYATRGVHPTTNLDFRHALTGIRFAVGQNLSWNKTIDKVEIRNAVMKSKYTLSKELNGTGATWHIQSTDPRGTATLSGVSVSTSESPNTTIMGNAGDNFTFYMIPQMLTGKGVTAYVHCTDGTEITAPLKGEWKAGTTRTYKLSQTNSTWQYTLTSTDPSRAAECNETTSQPYSITSYREDPVTHTKQAVAWKVIGYSVDNGTTWSTTKPAWLTALSAESGNGGTAAETGTATLTKDVKDLLKERNDGLKNATAVGTSSAPYDLSTHDLNGNTTLRSTANSYLISAPGHYRIPLVYGNAIKNGSDNPSSYQTSHTGTTILSNFQDHAGNAINDPWIEKTNGGANAGVNGAKIVWADEKDLVTSPSIAHDASNNAYLDFEVKAADIKSGNAVVAVTKGGTVVWSWHLWFAPQSALTPIPVTNYQNKVYNFTEETLGWKPTKWEGSTYNTPRTVKVRVEQTIANNGTKQVSDITITQNPGTVRTGIATLYQFGRKDAFPGMDETQLPQGSINKNAGNNMSITNGIQYPDRFYMSGSNWNNNYGYYNLWSADNMVAGSLNVGNDNPVVKTVYDPSPVGFKMPANNAFTGFTADGQNKGTMNVDGTDDLQTFSNNFGHNFWTSSSKTATIHFPASGYRSYDDGSLNSVGYNGYYWSAVPGYTYGGCSLSFKSDKVNPLDDITRSHGVAVRPVSE